MVGRCQAQFPSQVSRPVSPTPETHSAARAGHGSPPGCPATSPHITGSPGWCSDPGPRTASVPETTLHRVTTHTARHCGLCPECERRCLFQSSRLTPECPCPSPELNGMEATCPFRACGPRAWTRMTQARPPALEARSASEQAWGSSRHWHPAAQILGTRRWPPFPAHSLPRGSQTREDPAVPPSPRTEMPVDGAAAMADGPWLPEGAPCAFFILTSAPGVPCTHPHRSQSQRTPGAHGGGEPNNESPSEGVGYSAPKNGFHDAEPHLCPGWGPGGGAETPQAGSTAPSSGPATWPQRRHHFSRRKRPLKKESSSWFKDMYFKSIYKNVSVQNANTACV